MVEHYRNINDHPGNTAMFDNVTRILNANSETLPREALGLAGLCVIILSGLFLPALL
jgi:hypothetical protein